MVEQYTQGTYKNESNELVSNRYSFYNFSSYKTITLEKDLTLDEISYTYYGTPLLYWIIGEANDVSNPFKKLKKGVSVKIPEI